MRVSCLEVTAGRSDRYGRLDMRMMLVVQDLEIFELVIEPRRRATPDVQPGVGVGFARQLQLHLLEMIAIDMAIAAGPDEIADIESALLSDHVSEQCGTGEVDRNAQEAVGAALRRLARER